ncbi:unnamed protein product [Gordionus sp. m RMFG-2023]
MLWETVSNQQSVIGPIQPNSSTKPNYQYKKKQTKLKSRISEMLCYHHSRVPTREHWEKMVSTLYQKLEKPISNTLKNYETLSYEKYQSRSKTL